MKKRLLLIICILGSLNMFAQTKIKRSDLIGKWVIVSFDSKDMFYYNIENDSLLLGKKMKEQMTINIQDSIKKKVKLNLNSLVAKMFYTFNIDSTVEFYLGMSGSFSKMPYTVDEENSIITCHDKYADLTMKASKLKERLQIIMQPREQDGGGEIKLLMKRDSPKY